MFTTVGVCALAISRKVPSVMAPLSGAWFAAGTGIVCAEDSGDRSRREAITMPTASEATAMRSA
jgi:hypothetical protein